MRGQRNTENAYDKRNAGQTLATAEKIIKYGNAKPWDGLGADVIDKTTVAGMMKAAGLNWQVEKEQLVTEAGVQVPAYGLFRSSDHQFFDVVGPAYTPVQNTDAFEFFNEFVGKGDARMEVAGSMRNGAYVWGLASLGTSFKLNDGDEVKGYVMLACPHLQGKRLIIKFTSICGACNNMLLSALRSPSSKSKAGLVLPEFKHTHRKAFETDVLSKAKEALGIAREQLDQFAEQAAKLQKKRMGEQDAIDILAPIFAPKYEGEEAMTIETLTPRMKQLMEVMHEAPGADPGTAFGVLQATTYYVDHIACRTTDRRLQMSWFGKGGNQKLQVLDKLLTA